MRHIYLATLLATAALPLPALAQEVQGDAIVVRGELAEPSNWREAETEHLIVLSNGSEAELKRIAHNLERLHFLLSVLLGRYGKADDTLKLRVTLIGDTAEFDAMDLRNTRAQPGPYASAFPYQRYYDPREDGAVMAVSRKDQLATLQRGQNLATLLPALQLEVAREVPPGMEPQGAGATDPIPYSGLASSTSFGMSNVEPNVTANAVTVTLPAEDRIYAGFAQHYLLTHFPIAYPRWYVDGFGEIFATMRVKGGNVVEYGRAPEGFTRTIDWYRSYPLREVFSGAYLSGGKRTHWTPYHAWLLAHYFFFSDARRDQVRAYLTSVSRGADPAEAARLFGDMAQMERDVRAYRNKRMPYEEMTIPADAAAEPVVRRLTKGEAQFVHGRLELGGRVEIPPPPPTGVDPALGVRMLRDRETMIAARDRWLVELRRDAARFPSSIHAQLLLAEAECRSGNGAACLTAADRALAAQPDSVDALAWKGTAQTMLAVSADPAQRPVRMREARATIARANRSDPEATLPLLAYARSFTLAGEAPPEVALGGLMKALDAVPASPAIRLQLGTEFARRGMDGAAAKTLMPVANGAYATPEQNPARVVLGALPPLEADAAPTPETAPQFQGTPATVTPIAE